MLLNLPKAPRFFSRLKEIFRTTEERLSQMSRRRILLVVGGLALGFALLGGLLGIILVPYRPTATPSLDPNADGEKNLAFSYTGVVRILTEPIEGANYYLELEDGERLLLKSVDIDISFFTNAAVTVEGVVVETFNQGDQLIFVNRIRIK